MKKKILFLFISILTFNIIHSKVFIPKDGRFIEKQLVLKKETALNIANSLGYNSEQFYGHFNFKSKNKDIVFVGFKIFTDEIIFVWTKNSINNLKTSSVNEFLSNFDMKKEFDAYRIEGVLEDGIKNKSLTATFLSEIFNLENPGLNGILNATIIGYKIEFKQGIINKFYPSDGLNKWAKQWKFNFPELYNSYRNAAQKYWKDDENKIIEEINIQADAYANTPQGFANEYINSYSTLEGTVNFKMLMVAHYNDSMTLNEFKQVNYGRYILTSEFNNENGYKRTTYKLMKTLYTFSEDGKLVNTYLTN